MRLLEFSKLFLIKFEDSYTRQGKRLSEEEFLIIKEFVNQAELDGFKELI